MDGLIYTDTSDLRPQVVPRHSSLVMVQTDTQTEGKTHRQILLFILMPQVVPGRMALLVTLFLVLVNIFNNITTNTPKAEGKYLYHYHYHNRSSKKSEQ